MDPRRLDTTDRLFLAVDNGLRSLLGHPKGTGRHSPAEGVPEAALTEEERRVAAGLMRVNHAGEVSAQGLYQGQALTARLPGVRDQMERAAEEENDHLLWCEQRLSELESRPSLLGPFWYAGSLAIGAAAGLAGDRWSLGFLAETERQVVAHLDGHLPRLPAQDDRSRAVIQQMREDEAGHAESAVHAGGAELPRAVRRAMGLVSRVMTRSAYYV